MSNNIEAVGGPVPNDPYFGNNTVKLKPKIAPAERCAEIAKQLYVGGEPPDVWVVMMEGLVTRHLEEAYREGFQEAAELSSKLASVANSHIAEAIRALKPGEK